MAQGHINYAKGEEKGSFDTASDATSLGSHDIPVIVDDTNLTRDEAAQALRDMADQLQDGRQAYPLA